MTARPAARWPAGCQGRALVAQQHGLAIGTVRNAVKLLRDESLIETTPGWAATSGCGGPSHDDVMAEDPGNAVNWSRRYKANTDRLRSGERDQIAEVVRGLGAWERDHPWPECRGAALLWRARQLLQGHVRPVRRNRPRQIRRLLFRPSAGTAAIPRPLWRPASPWTDETDQQCHGRCGVAELGQAAGFAIDDHAAPGNTSWGPELVAALAAARPRSRSVFLWGLRRPPVP